MALGPDVRRLSTQQWRGGHRQALGFNLESIRGSEPDVLKAAAQRDRQAFEQVEAAILKGLPRMTEEGRPSTGQDIVKGRRTEIDFINGLVADKGDEAGIPTPTHRALVEVVKQVERKEVEPDPSLVHAFGSWLGWS
jgi:2-dehydropantoate 2-reductase